MALFRFVLLAVVLWRHTTGRLLDLADGAVEGREEGRVGVWLGIPYAAPPTGELRWRPPQPPKPWRPKTLQATDFRATCYQAADASMGYPQTFSTMSEDCLYLNVYAPLENASSLPVMFWIHGGGFQGGGGNETRLNGTWDVALTGGKVLVVTINYRLGVFGFAASDRLRSRDPERGTGNYGILDQRLAMRWAQSNIASFGGDKDRVFIVGQSAGAMSVSQHLVRTKSSGLFHAAGMESGAFYESWPSTRETTVRQQEPYFQMAMEKANCSSVECLVNMPAIPLLQLSLTQPDSIWSPVVDGVDHVDDAALLAEQGKLAKVPVIVGSTMEDGTWATPPIGGDPNSYTKADFQRWLHKSGMNAEEVQNATAIYSVEEPRPGWNKWYTAAYHAGADAWATCPARRTARWVRSVGQRAYLYYWTYIPKGPNGQGLAHHSVEQPFVFHVLSESPAELTDDHGNYHIDKSEVGFSGAIVQYWVSFASTTVPQGTVAWPSNFDENGILLLGDEMKISVVQHPRTKQCDFWDAHDAKWKLAADTTSVIV